MKGLKSKVIYFFNIVNLIIVVLVRISQALNAILKWFGKIVEYLIWMLFTYFFITRNNDLSFTRSWWHKSCSFWVAALEQVSAADVGENSASGGHARGCGNIYQRSVRSQVSLQRGLRPEGDLSRVHGEISAHFHLVSWLVKPYFNVSTLVIPRFLSFWKITWTIDS